MSVSKTYWLNYEFLVFDPRNTRWENVGGLYIFAGLNRTRDAWLAYYVGQTSSFAQRLPGHEKWPAAARLGATHVHARVERLQANRLRIERELIDYYDPPLNRQ